MLRLFLKNYEIELTEDIQVAITKQFEDVTNPTSIINDWSKTVKIPATSHNNKIFGHLNNVDKLTVSGSGSIGVYFDPYKKIDFRLQWGDAIVMTGYAKNVSCDKDYYNLTLNGELGKVFQEMKKITFDKTTDDTKYLIDGSQYIDETINKDLVYRLWNNEPDFENLNLIDKYIWSFNATTGEKVKQINGAYKTQNYLGFAPNNGFNEGFDYSIFEKYSKALKFVDTLEKRNDKENYFLDATGVSADNVLPNGITPRGIGEFRSYLQLPYIYWNKLFQIFTKKTKEITGYDCILNQDWFNKTNPYWSRLVYMLKSFNFKDTSNVASQDIVTKIANTITSWYPAEATSLSRDPGWTKSKGIYLTFENSSSTTLENYPLPNANYNIVKVFVGNVILRLYNFGGNVTSFNPNNPLNIRIVLTGNETIERYIKIVPTGTDIEVDDKTTVVLNFNDLQTITENGRQYTVLPELQAFFKIDEKTFGNNIKITYYLNWETESNPTKDGSLTSSGNTASSISLDLSSAVGSVNVTSYNDVFRSGAEFTLNDLWNSEINLFDEILNYCKMYRIGIFCDYFNKQLIFKPLHSFFTDYKIEEWTTKVDLGKDYHIEPITFDSKYVLFNYKDMDVKINKDYKEKYGLNFGEYKLSTAYEFNTETKNLFNKINVGVPYTPTFFAWDNLYFNSRIIYTLPNEIFPHNIQDEKVIDLFGCYFIYNGLTAFDTNEELNLSEPSITDDTYFQIYNNIFCYSQYSDKLKSLRYPKLDIAYDKHLCTFATPMYNYTYNKQSYNNKKGIYENFWKNYLDERYNVQNKIVTCYIYLKPGDYINFSFNKFVKINNQIYMVNKIYDYDITSSEPTKVDLITIQNIEGYTKALTFDWFQLYNSKQQPWDYYRDYITLTDVGQTQTIYVTSSKPVTWTDTSSALQSMLVYYNNDESNATNASGTIPAGEKIPVTFKMNEPYDEFGDVIFKSGDKEFKVSVALIYDETFEVYYKNTAGNYVTWSNDDYIDLRDEDETFTLYISSDEFTPVTWEDVDASLQDLNVNGTNGRGTIPAGDKVPVVFSVRNLIDSEGTIRFTNGHKDIDVFVRLYIDKTFTIYDSDKTVWASTDKVDLQNTEPTMKTIYITTPNVPLYWEIMSSDLNDLGVCVDDDISDWGCYEFTRGVIPIGTMIPVTFRMNPAGDVNRIDGQIRFYNTEISKTINVRLIWNEIFTVYNWNGEVWDEEVDYILLGGTDITKTIYLTANSDVEWYDDSSELQNLYIYSGEDPGDYGDYDRGSGVIPKPSNMKPIYFRLDPDSWETGSSGNIMLFNGRHEWKIPVRLYAPDVPALNGIKVYRSDKQPWDFDFDYIELEPHTSKTIYMTSTTDIEWYSDVNIQNNVEVNGEVGNGQIQAGNQVAITFFNDEYTPCEGYIRFENQYQQYVEIFVRIK